MHLSRGILLAVALALPLTAVLPAVAADPPGESRETMRGPAAEHADALGPTMKDMGRSFKALVGQLANKAANAQSLELVSRMEADALKAKALVPPLAGEKQGDEREKYIAEYRVQLINLLDELLKVEKALVAGDNAQAQAMVSDLKRIMDAGHKEFRPHRDRE